MPWIAALFVPALLGIDSLPEREIRFISTEPPKEKTQAEHLLFEQIFLEVNSLLLSRSNETSKAKWTVDISLGCPVWPYNVS